MGKNILSLIGKKYVFEILNSLKDSEKRFKDMEPACKNEKMRSQRLKELEDEEFIKVRVERVGRRPVSIYTLNEKGKKILKLMEEIKKVGSPKYSV